VLAVGLVTAGTAAAVQASPPLPAPTGVEAANSVAAKSAATFVSQRPSVLQPSTDDAYVQKSLIASGNAKYISYERTYKGLPVVGGDFVVVTDSAGAAKFTSVSQTQAIGNLSTTAKISSADAAAVASKQLTSVSNVEGTKLVVYTLDGAAKLAYETTVNGTGAEGVSRLTVRVDALTGAVLSKQERVMHGTGTGWIVGNVSLNTTLSGSTYSMKDPNYTNISCQNATVTPRSPAPMTCGAAGSAPTARPAASTPCMRRRRNCRCCRRGWAATASTAAAAAGRSGSA